MSDRTPRPWQDLPPRPPSLKGGGSTPPASAASPPPPFREGGRGGRSAEADRGIRSVHLVGIGGGHMSAIAQVLLAQGVRVSGSDRQVTPLTEKLVGLGARVFEGHDAANVGDAALVVTTAAAKDDNPELVEAARRGIRVISRAAMVARLLAGRTSVAVAGTHGKTTTTSMIAWLLVRAGRDPTALIGAESIDLGSNARVGAGPAIVVEADEYARAFLEYEPDVAVVLNVEADHLEYYGTVEAYEDAFRGFMRRVRPDGVMIACAASPRLLALSREAYAARVERYAVAAAGEDATPTDGSVWLAHDHGPADLGGRRFDVLRAGEPFGAFALRVPGRHNVENALGAIAAGAALGLDAETMAAALAEFRGVRRRFELVGEAAGVTIVDDFGHHPTEIAANIRAMRERFPRRRLVVVFQPHTYSRTAYLLDAFRGCFAGADRLLVLETYAARETAAAGLGAEELATAVIAPAGEYARSVEDAAGRLVRDLQSGDVLLTIGAGDVDRVARAVHEGLHRR